MVLLIALRRFGRFIRSNHGSNGKRSSYARTTKIVGKLCFKWGGALDAYPVGSIYMSVNSTSPSTLFGGTWQRIQDRFLIAAGSTYKAGGTGGEATHTLTIGEMPSHTHNASLSARQCDDRFDTAYISTGGMGSYNRSFSVTVESSGGSAAHNNMPPYLAVYVWKRTA